jgi:hypothetical protein
VDFEIPADLAAYLGELDEFIEREIRPVEQQDDNIRFFDYRREDARTDWDRGGLPDRQWEALLRDRAMQVHGGLGYSRHKPFEHIYRHHRRYRITEGTGEIQMRRVAGYMFGYRRQRAPKGVTES